MKWLGISFVVVSIGFGVAMSNIADEETHKREMIQNEFEVLQRQLKALKKIHEDDLSALIAYAQFLHECSEKLENATLCVKPVKTKKNKPD